MNRPFKPLPAASDALRSGTTGPALRSPAGAGPNPIGAVPGVAPKGPTGEAGAPNLSNPTHWGNDPICPSCNRGKTYSCICDPFFEDDEQMPASDVVRIMGQLYHGWARVEL